MAFDLHTVSMIKGSTMTWTDRILVYTQANVPNLAGTAGTDVTTAVAPTNDLPANYIVLVTPNQDAMASVTSKTSTGFNVVLTPKVATATIAAGTFDVLVIA